MFCPDCGTENSRGQKFCTRCGNNLIAVERAREIVADVSQAPTHQPISSSTVLRILALICTVGFIAVTTGVMTLASMEHGGGPGSFFFGLFGLTALVLICRFLIKLLHLPAKPETRFTKPVAYASPALANLEAPPEAPIHTNRALGQAQPSYQSVIEDPTLQFDRQRRNQ